ncbi:cytochrome P450 [Cunninghamella echinulata]|nr:cytochrome P450 [Cunninghamella echinulata]
MITLSPIKTITTIVIIGITTKYIYQFITSKEDKENEKYRAFYSIPSPPHCIPFFGHLPFLGPSFALKLHYWHRKYGPLLRIKMGTQSWLTVIDPGMADELLEKSRDIVMSRPYHRFIDEHYSGNQRGIVYASREDSKYLNARATVLKYISSEAIVDPLIEYEVDEFIQRIINKTETESSVNPFWELKLMCINTFMTVAFAKSLDSIDDFLFTDGEAILNENFPLIGITGDPSSFIPFLKWFPFVSKSKTYLDQVIQHRNSFFHQMIDYGLDETTAHCLVKEIYAVKHLYGFDDQDILVTLSDMNGMASDLPPTAFAWCLAILTHHLDVQEKIRQEVVQYLREHDDQFPRINDIHLFPYTQSVLKECLRYRCSNNFSVPRKFDQDVTVNGIVIPKGTVIALPMYALHLNKHTYQNADTFDPERFINNTSTISETSTHHYNDRDIYLFGFGPRRCPGIQMVERQMFYLLVRLFYHCRIECDVDKNGNPIEIDLNKTNDIGVMLRPGSFHIRAIERLPPTPMNIDSDFDLDDDDDE